MSDFVELKESELWNKGCELATSIANFDSVLCKNRKIYYKQAHQMLRLVISAYIDGNQENKTDLYFDAIECCNALTCDLNEWAGNNFNSFDIIAPILFKLEEYIDIISIEIKSVARLSA